jgi:hypothetical protein
MTETMGNPNWEMLAPWVPLRVPANATTVQVYDGICLYHGVQLYSVGTVVLAVHDAGTTGSNGRIDNLPITAIIGDMHLFDSGIQCLNGIQIIGNALNGNCIIYYRPIPQAFRFPYP